MWSRLATAHGLAALSLVAGCGGNVEGGSRAPDPRELPPAAKPPAVSSGAEDPAADIELGDCVLGKAEERGMDGPCAWVVDDRCYEMREMACNCACPRSRDSQCASGFDSGPNGHVWVACQ